MIWFTSDTHYGHEKLIGTGCGMGLRPLTWPTVAEMDEAILDACNSVVDHKDTLYHLGDFAFANPAGYQMKIKCKDLRFIWGNHDKRSIQHLFRFQWDVKMAKIGEQPVWLSHYPHMIWPQSHYGALHLYGHMHGQKEKAFDSIWPEHRSMDVGVDNIYTLLGSPRPISEKEVLDRLMARKGHDPVEFYRDAN